MVWDGTFVEPISNQNDHGILHRGCPWNKVFMEHKSHQRWVVFVVCSMDAVQLGRRVPDVNRSQQVPPKDDADGYQVPLERTARLICKLHQRWGVFVVCQC